MDTVVQAAFSAPAMQESSSAARHTQCHSGVCFLTLLEGKAGLKTCKFVPHSLITCSNYTFAFYSLFFFFKFTVDKSMASFMPEVWKTSGCLLFYF